MIKHNNLINYKGCYSIQIDKNIISEYTNITNTIPSGYIEYKNKRDGINNYHITIITSQEAKQINKEELDKILQNQIPIKVDVLGLGTNNDCYYLVCVSSQLDNIRKKLNLKSKDFHITLGFAQSDQHNISKSIITLTNPVNNYIDKVIDNLSLDIEKNIKLLKELELKNPNNLLIIKNLINEYSKNSNYQVAFEYSKLMIELFTNNIIGYYTLVKLMEKTESYDVVLIRNIYSKLTDINIETEQKKITFETIKKINEIIIKFNFLEIINDELNQINTFKIINYDTINEKISHINFNFKINCDFNQTNIISLLTNVIKNLEKNNNLTYLNYFDMFLLELNNQIILSHENPNKNIWIFSKLSAEQDTLYQIELPINFSIVGINLFGSGMISPRHIVGLNNLGINTIINLIGEEKPSDETIIKCKKLNINLIHIGFKDRTACSFETYLQIQEIISKNNTGQNKCIIHCKGGIGRTNMILAGFLMYQNNLTPAESIGLLKKSRKVIMVPEQIMLLKKYYGYVTNLKMNISSPLSNSSILSNIQLPPILNGLVIMVGLPCSGKSTLSMEIYSKYSSTKNITHLNQDEIGKNACEELLSSNAKISDLIIIDRCNPISTDRIHWVNIYRGLTNKKITILFLNLGLETSLERLKTRQNHLTLGKTGGKIIEDMDKKIIIPSKSEGWDELIQINTISELEQFKEKIGLGLVTNPNPNPKTPINLDKIIKFPRTKHIMNLGAMTRDDLLMDKTDIDTILSGEIVVEEKIDGANLGFRLNPETNSIIAQNRSHYVSSISHPQFKKLDQWIESNRIGLQSILSQGNYIIYGEWLYSKHSINYTKLPDYFIMFDLYDVDTNTFFSRSYVEKIIKGTGITLVPLIFKGKITLDKLKILAQQTKSQYYDGIVEGVYIRSFGPGPNSTKLQFRCKIVRSDFISGDEHWTKGKQTLNIVSKNF